MAGYNQGDGKITVFIDTATGTATTNLAQITFGVRDQNGAVALEPDDLALQDFCDALNVSGGLWDSLCWDGATIVGARFDGYDGYVVETTLVAPIAGGITVNTSSQTVLGTPTSVVVQKRCTQRGRRFRGRFFLPHAVLNLADARSGLIPGAALSTYQGYADTTFTELNTSLNTWTVPAELALVSPAPDVGPAFPSRTVSNFVVSGIVGIQRRRLTRG